MPLAAPAACAQACTGATGNGTAKVLPAHVGSRSGRRVALRCTAAVGTVPPPGKHTAPCADCSVVLQHVVLYNTHGWAICTATEAAMTLCGLDSKPEDFGARLLLLQKPATQWLLPRTGLWEKSDVSDNCLQPRGKARGKAPCDFCRGRLLIRVLLLAVGRFVSC